MLLATVSIALLNVDWCAIHLDGLGVARGVPSLFYFVSAAAGAVQMLILAALVRAPDPAPSVKAE